ncbi:MAG: sel1 repeat family protein [Thermoplasmata archaeon]|jgi:hypothetical protein|nr:sel1 repeat family protein [Thermoplasmata archaeon]
MTDGEVFFLAILMLALCFAPYFIGEANKRSNNERIRDKVFSGNFIPADEFDREWVVKGFAGNYGSKYNDGPGCYIILMFDAPVNDGDYSDYINGYIGQSVNACARVHNHLNGKGNGDVYADRKNGKHLYVKIISCDRSELNSLERQLIASFDKNRLYNKNKGGGVKHGDIPDRTYSGSYVPKQQSAPKMTVQQKQEAGKKITEQYSEIARMKSLALEGDITSQYKLGVAYEHGIGVNKDDFEAAMWYKKAAEQNHASAMYQLAIMYMEGRGTYMDIDETKRLLKRLKERGDRKASDLLEYLESKENDRLWD